jgi:hypothetical protein
LHATRLCFAHPVRDEEVVCEVAMPMDMQALLAELDANSL